MINEIIPLTIVFLFLSEIILILRLTTGNKDINLRNLYFKNKIIKENINALYLNNSI